MIAAQALTRHPSFLLHATMGHATCRVLSFCQEHSINALRIPLSLSLALNFDTTYVAASDCVECAGALAIEVLDKLFAAAAEKGILLLLDSHRTDPVRRSAAAALLLYVCALLL